MEKEGTITENRPKKGATARGFKRVREPQKPSNYAVVLHNDNYTTKDFVVYVLQEVFHHSFIDAERIMLNVHENGLGVAGIYHFEIAEEKAYHTADLAKEYEYPLKITIEKVNE